MRKRILLFYLACILTACTDQTSFPKVKVQMPYDTLYDYNHFKVTLDYSEFNKLRERDSIQELKLTDLNIFPEQEIYLTEEHDAIPFQFDPWYMTFDSVQRQHQSTIEKEFVEFKFHLRTTSGIDTTLLKRVTYYLNHSVHSPFAEGTIKNGKRTGKWKIYYTPQKKNIHRIFHYDDNGFKTGTDTSFTLEGKPYSIIEWKAGLKHGIYKTFHNSGKISMEGFYKEGFPDSTWRIISSSGILASLTEYSKGKRISYKNVYKKNIKVN